MATKAPQRSTGASCSLRASVASLESSTVDYVCLLSLLAYLFFSPSHDRWQCLWSKKNKNRGGRWHCVCNLLSMLGRDGWCWKTEPTRSHDQQGECACRGGKGRKGRGRRSAPRLIMVLHSSTPPITLAFSHSHSCKCTLPASGCL